jgi:hypothetical protein
MNPIGHPRGSTVSLAGDWAIDGVETSLPESKFSGRRVMP